VKYREVFQSDVSRGFNQRATCVHCVNTSHANIISPLRYLFPLNSTIL